MRSKQLTIPDVAHKTGIPEDEIRGILSGDTVMAETYYRLWLIFDIKL